MLNSLYNSLNSAILVDLLVEICYNYKKSYMVNQVFRLMILLAFETICNSHLTIITPTVILLRLD